MNKNKLLALLLVAVLVISLLPSAFAANGSETYVKYYNNGSYEAQKLSEVLAADPTYGSRYSIYNFEVDLFDYDPLKINDSLDAATSDAKGFHFTGYGDETSNSGINNTGAEHAKQGIVESTLSDGLPVIKYLSGADAGKKTGQILFGDTVQADGKTIYNDIPFEFVYDHQTGFYEYKSSANHAQLNAAHDKIELYADTLSTDNSYAATLDLSTATGANDINSAQVATSSYKGTAHNPDTTSRLDPYVSFTVKDVSASTVSKIYVKIKIPENVGTNKFQLYFDTSEASGTYDENKSFKVDYTATGDWIEFVIDTSQNSTYWTGTLTGIRIDPFDQNYDADKSMPGDYQFEIAQISLITMSDTTTTRGGFYPFSDITKSYPGNNAEFDLSTWSSLVLNNSQITARASRSIGNPTWASTNEERYSELAYGMTMEVDFYIPVDKTGEDLTYHFNGDDDLWIFVDNQLVLDIGGGHGAITGTVNFTTGEVVVDSALPITGYDSCGTASTNVETELDDSLTAPGKHTMKIFYLERGGSVSNCYMKFNLPQTPQGSVSVTKNVAEVEGADTSVLENVEFTFQITTKDLGANSDGQVYPVANEDFYIIGVNGITTPAKTDAEGKFTIKDGEEAIFDIDENYEVTVIETLEEIPGYTWTTTQINEQENVFGSQTTVENQESRFSFINTYNEIETQYTYIAVNPNNCPTEIMGTVKDTANGSYVGQTSEEIGVCVGTPVGSVAKESNAVEFVGWYSDPECENLVSDKESFVPTDKVNGLWPGGTYYAKFVYKYGNLTISKSGISDLDHHEASASNKEEWQSTIYVVQGTSEAGDEIYLEVVIHGNQSVTIKDLPVGTYTVTEKTDWSWRYDLDGDNDHQVSVVGGQTAETEFKNNREEDQWLSGDNFWKNIFGLTPDSAPNPTPTEPAE